MEIENIKYGKYKGKFLNEFSKEELMDIIIEIEDCRRADNERHEKDLDKIYGE